MTKSLHESIRSRLLALEESGGRRFPRQVDSLPGGRCVIGGKDIVNFGSNDYLGLAHHPHVCAAFAEAANRQTGAMASSLIVGRSSIHAELEQRLAEFENCEAALLFPTGFAANVGVIQALAKRDDAIFSERENHASLIDGCRTSGASVHVYDRHDLDGLAQQLRQKRGAFQHGFLITDGVFSMDGTVAPLQELCDIADEFDLAVIVDEAHGTGVLGEHGRGACELTGVEDRTFLRIGTLSKALGGLGGFAAGSRETIEWLRNRARPQFFSTASPPAVCAAVLESLSIVQSEPTRRHAVCALAEEARAHARSLGLEIRGDGPAPIIPVLTSNDTFAVDLTSKLQAAGWFVPAILPPTVAPGASRLRISLTTDHQLSGLIPALEFIAAETGS